MAKHHTALPAGGVVLPAHETEGGKRTELSHAFPLVLGVMGLGAVLNHREIMAPGHLHDRPHVARLACNVRHHDRRSTLRDGLLDPRGRHVEAARFRIREHRNELLHHRRHDTTRIGDGRDDNLGTRLQMQRRHRRMDCRGSGTHGRGVRASHVRGKLLLIGIHLGSAVTVKRQPLLDRAVEKTHRSLLLSRTDKVTGGGNLLRLFLNFHEFSVMVISTAINRGQNGKSIAPSRISTGTARLSG